MNTNEFLRKTFKLVNIDGRAASFVRPRVTCKDGYSISIQAHDCAYCTPRVTGLNNYATVELGFPSVEDDLINDYAEDDDYTCTVYGYVPVELVDELLEKHGGIVSF